ncbi:hypothetical protein DER44DRAFT_901917 [Fusarium oxysporum]|nr:hypothetical protein DER44DRAFT_901917 [Fusarium oxysporum]
MQNEVMNQSCDAAGGQLRDQACSHQESSIQELPKKRLDRPSSNTSKKIMNSEALFNKRFRVNIITPPAVTFSDPSPSSHASIVDDGSSLLPSGCHDSCSEDTYSSSSIVPSPSRSISPKRLARTASFDASDEEDPSPKRTRTSVDHVTIQRPSTTNILARFHAIYLIPEEHTECMKKNDVLRVQTTGPIDYLVKSGAYDNADMGRVWNFYEAYGAWYANQGRKDQL